MGNGQAWRKARRVGALGLALLLGAGAASAETDPCAPWPGEPMPLPKVTDPDDLRGRWAGLRVQELSKAATDLEEGAPLRARALWARVLCLYPGSAEAEDGLERTRAAAVHKPLIVTTGSSIIGANGWDTLSSELRVTVSRPRPEPAPTPATPAAPNTADFDAALVALEGQVKAAQFEAALESAARGRAAAKQLGGAADTKRAAQLEVLAATAALALGRGDDATSSFGRALDQDPQLALDPATTSPKVRRALERARAERTR